MERITNHLKSLKLFTTLYNLVHRKKLEHNKAQYKKYGLNKPIYFPISSSDVETLSEGKRPWLDVKDSKEVLPGHPVLKKVPQEVGDQLLNWSEKGYLIWKSFLPQDKIEAINNKIQKGLDSGTMKIQNRTKVMFAFQEIPEMNEAMNDPVLLEVLETILGRGVLPFQSINFIKPSQQRAHSDSVHMTTYPLGYLTAIWIALEDIDEENGPLFYYPGSHKLPYILNKDFQHGGNFWKVGEHANRLYEDKVEDMIQQYGLKKETLHAKAGDALIWHSNLLHGGSPLLDQNRTRKSMVFHYYGDEVIKYHELSQRPTLYGI
jgi:hypothetical protein